MIRDDVILTMRIIGNAILSILTRKLGVVVVVVVDAVVHDAVEGILFVIEVTPSIKRNITCCSVAVVVVVVFLMKAIF